MSSPSLPTDAKSTFMHLRDKLTNSDAFKGHRRTLPILLDLLKVEIEADRPLTDAEIGADYYSRLENLHERVRRAQKALADIRTGLATFFSSAEGRDEPFAIHVSEGPERKLFFRPNIPPPPSTVDLFWGPYLGDLANNTLIFTEPLFYRKKSDLIYLRNIHCNDEDIEPSLALAPIVNNPEDWERSYHYMSSGEVMGILRLISELSFRSNIPPAQQGAASGSPQRGKSLQKFRCEFITAKDTPRLTALERENLVVIGSSRTNWILRHYQRNEEIILDDRAVKIAQAGPEEQAEYCDVVDSLPLYKYAVLTRRRQQGGHRTIILIGANHGRATEGVMNRLTDERSLADLFKTMRLSDKLPEHIQVLFRVLISKDRGEADIEEAKPIAWRVHFERPPETDPGDPTCPKCGKELIRHESHYWGC